MQKKLLFIIYSILVLGCPVFGQQVCTAPKITDASGNENPYIDCDYPLSGDRLQLSVTYPTFNATTQYEMAPRNFEPYLPFNAGTPLYANEDDRFISKIQLPFTFCYFGNNYSEVIVGTNGMLTFDQAQLNNVNYPNIENPNPNPMLPKSSIFGPFSDLVFSVADDSEIYYSIIGAAPCRKLVINFYKGRLVGCNESSTSQIVLSEGSNTVEIFVENKPLPCADAKFKNSLLGMINADRTIGYSPGERNTGIWEAQNEAWIFTPSGAEITPQVSWFDAQQKLIGTGDSIMVQPLSNQIYTVKVSYPICGSANLIMEDTSEVTFAPDFPLARDFTKVYCGNTTFDIFLSDFKSELTPQDPANLRFTYHNSLADADAGTNSQPEQLTLTGNRIFFVRIENRNDPGCFRIAELKLNLISKSLLADEVSICDINNDGVESGYELSLLNNSLFATPINGTIQYFLSEADAMAGTGAVQTADLRDGSLLYVNYKTASCSQTFGPIRIKFKPSPTVNSPLDFSLTTCDLKRDYVEPFDFETELGPLVTNETNVTIRFYGTYQQAYAGTAGTLTTIHEGNYQVFARVEEPGGCFSIATVNMNIIFTKIEAKDSAVYICFDGTQDITVELDNYAPAMLIDSPIGITTTYHNTEADAELDRNPIPSSQIITRDGNLVTQTYYVRFANASGCYAIKNLKVNLVHVVIAKSAFTVCDFGNDGTESVTLSTLSREIAGTQNAVVSYFTTREDAERNERSVTKHTIQGPTRLYVRIQSYGCTEVFEITVSLTPTPVVKAVVTEVRNSVCDNNNDGVEPFDLTQLTNTIYSGTDRVTIQYYTGYNTTTNQLTGLIAKPEAFPVPRIATVYAKVSFAGGCYSVSTVHITLNFLPAIILNSAVLQKCDYEFNLNESFELMKAIPQLFDQAVNSNDLSDLKVEFFRTRDYAEAGNPINYLKNIYTPTDSRVTVWARFTSKTTGCYSVAPIELQTFVPPKARNSAITGICDDNLDGLYEVDLTRYTGNMVYHPSEYDVFTFYLTNADATAKAKAISDPQNFTFAPDLKRIWVRVENIPGCYDIAAVDLAVGTKVTLNPGPYKIDACDTNNDGEELIDLTQFQQQLYPNATHFEYYPSFSDLNRNTNRISDPSQYIYNEAAEPSAIFVKVRAAGFCPEKAEIQLSLRKTPMFTLEPYYFCPTGFVDIEPDLSNLDIETYEWRDPAGKVISRTNRIRNVRVAGTYSVTVTARNGCPFTTSFEVREFEVPVITELIPSGHSYTVIAKGSGAILYSLDGINWQPGNTFANLPFGVITFYVRFADRECQGVPKQGLVLDIKNAFTPNDDGINDTWIIDDLHVFEGKTANLKVYNRYQQLIYEQDSNTRLEWNGRTGLRVVPTASYWYVLTLADGRVFTGWVLLKNRN